MIHDYPFGAVDTILAHRYQGVDFDNRTARHQANGAAFGAKKGGCGCPSTEPVCRCPQPSPQASASLHPQAATSAMLQHRYG